MKPAERLVRRGESVKIFPINKRWPWVVLALGPGIFEGGWAFCSSHKTLGEAEGEVQKRTERLAVAGMSPAFVICKFKVTCQAED